MALGGIIIGRVPCVYLQNRQCVAACISCKLHTCYYLKSQGVEFKINKMLFNFSSKFQYLKNSLNWEQFCEPLQGLNTGSNPDFIKRITIISNKGKAIS